MDKLVRAIDQTFTELNIKRTSDWKVVGGRAGVGEANCEEAQPIWTDEQLGLVNGTSPRTLRNGQKALVDAKAVRAARDVFNVLLGPVNNVPVEGTSVTTKPSLKKSTNVNSTLKHERVHAPAPLPPPIGVAA